MTDWKAVDPWQTERQLTHDRLFERQLTHDKLFERQLNVDSLKDSEPMTDWKTVDSWPMTDLKTVNPWQTVWKTVNLWLFEKPLTHDRLNTVNPWQTVWKVVNPCKPTTLAAVRVLGGGGGGGGEWTCSSVCWDCNSLAFGITWRQRTVVCIPQRTGTTLIARKR